jgi:hypothetical protein
LKIPKPDGHKEDLGIVVLDEPALNPEDKTVLELKYIDVARMISLNLLNWSYQDAKDKINSKSTHMNVN